MLRAILAAREARRAAREARKAALAARGMAMIELHDERGGSNVFSQLYRRWQVSRMGPVLLTGKCRSFGTILTTLPNVALHRDLEVGFHGMWIGRVPLPFLAMVFLAPFYRGGARRAFILRWQFAGWPFDPSGGVLLSAEAYQRLDPKVKIAP